MGQLGSASHFPRQLFSTCTTYTYDGSAEKAPPARLERATDDLAGTLLYPVELRGGLHETSRPGGGDERSFPRPNLSSSPLTAAESAYVPNSISTPVSGPTTGLSIVVPVRLWPPPDFSGPSTRALSRFSCSSTPVLWTTDGLPRAYSPAQVGHRSHGHEERRER
jgi:hypothetical protein